MAPAKRPWFAYLADCLFAWQHSLPAETCSYTVESVRIPVGHEQMELTAELYRTLASPPAGTLLVRTPYGTGFAPSLGSARFFAARGYHVLFSACRGTSGSDGELIPGVDEGSDGQAVVEWMRLQSWYTHSFATLGGSYLGFTQWSLLVDPPKDMKAAAIFTGPHDMYGFALGAGAMRSHMVTWADLTTRMNRGDGLISMMLYLRSMHSRIRPTLDSVPLLDAVDEYFSGTAPAWLRSNITGSSERSAGLDASEALDRASIPILLVAGWYDMVLDDVMKQYARLSRRGCTVALVVGPWTHIGAQGRNIPAETLPWIEEHLAGKPSAGKRSPVRIFVTGIQEWRDLSHWPPATSPREWFLSSERQLTTNKPTAETSESTITFDPTNPTPAIGAPQSFAGAKGTSDENSALVARDDVLSWTSSALAASLEVCGKPLVTLHHATDLPDADLLVVLSEVDERDGTSRQLSERYLRLDPRRRGAVPPLQLRLHDVAHVFRAGTRVRLSVAGGSHPRFIRNLGSGENPGTGTTLWSVKHLVRHQEGAVSSLRLPVVAVTSA